MLRFTLSLLFLFCVIGNSLGQSSDSLNASSLQGKYRYLLLSKAGTIKRYRIHIGETITYKLKGSKRWQTDKITNIKDNSFFIQYLEVPLGRVEKIQLKNHTGGRKLAAWSKRLLQGAGGVFLLVGGINFFHYSEDRSDGLQTMGAAAGALVIGHGIGELRKGNYKIGGTWTMKVIEMY